MQCVCGGQMRMDNEGFHYCSGCDRKGWSLAAIVVSRHEPLLEYLIEEEILPEGPVGVVTHVVTPFEIKGRHVYGNIPLRLAAAALKVTTVPMVIPEEKRGQELSLDDVRRFATNPRTFEVTEITEEEA